MSEAMSDYNLQCLRNHFERRKLGYGNRRHERISKHARSRSKPATRLTRERAERMERGRRRIDLFIERGIKLNAKRVRRNHIVSAIRRARIADILNSKREKVKQ